MSNVFLIISYFLMLLYRNEIFFILFSTYSYLKFRCITDFCILTLQLITLLKYSFYQFSSVAQSRLTFCDPMDCSTPGFSVHQLPLLELAQTHVLRVSDIIQPSHPLSPPSPVFNLFQHQGLFSESVLLIQFSSVEFSPSVVSNSLRPHESQHARPPCPSPTPRVYSNSCPSSG